VKQQGLLITLFTDPLLARHFSLSVCCAQHKRRLNYLAFLGLLLLSFLPKEASPQAPETPPANHTLPQQNPAVWLGKVILPTPRYQIASTEKSFSTDNRNEISLLLQARTHCAKTKQDY